MTVRGMADDAFNFKIHDVDNRALDFDYTPDSEMKNKTNDTP